MFDSFIALCPHCGRETEAQTKQFECSLRKWTPGRRGNLGPDFQDVTMRFTPGHNTCRNCGKAVVAQIVNNRFVGFVVPDGPEDDE